MKKYILLINIIYLSSNFAYAESFSDKVFAKIYSSVYAERSSADINNQKSSNIYAESYAEIKIKFFKYVDLKTSWSFLNVKKPESKNAFFEKQGLVLDELYLNIHDDFAGIHIGKFNPRFAIGWDHNLMHGIWSNEFAQEYQLVGKLGAGIEGRADLEDKGVHKFYFSGFYNDSSIFNDSIFSRREQVQGESGSSANDNSLSSYIISLSGEDMVLMPKLFYNISYRSLDPYEEGYSFAVGLRYDFTDNFKIHPFFEMVTINNFNSSNNRFGAEFSDILPGDYEYSSFIFPIRFARWGLTYAHLYKDIDLSSQVQSNKKQQEISLSYNIGDNIKVELGRKREDISDQKTINNFGLVFNYSNDF
jgi:hypothetical protein